MKTAAYQKGKDSFLAGFNENDVVKFYPEDSKEAKDWISGFNHAKTQGNKMKNDLFETNFCNTAVFPYYNQPHRFYHTYGHINAMMAIVQDKHLELSVAQQLAIWYHDAVYVPGSATNEEDSALLMQTLLTQLSIGKKADELIRYGFTDKKTIEIASQIILDTKLHKPTIEESALVLDLDMSILATSLERYMEYTVQVRTEFLMYTDEQFKAGRKAFIEKTLAAGKWFHTEEFASCNAKARSNLLVELSSLQ